MPELEGIEPSKKYRTSFYTWLEQQYGWQAWIIKQRYGEPPWYQGDNPYYDFWLSANKPTDKILATPTTPQEEVPPKPTVAPEGDPEQTEQERLATQMGISVQDLLRYQYRVPVEEQGLTPWQQTQAQQWEVGQATQRQQSWWDLQRQREMTRQAQYGYGQQRYAHQLGGLGGDIREAQRAQLGKDWQAWQNRLAGEATWPQSEILRTQENPFERTPESIGDELQSLKGEFEFAKEKADWFRKRQKDPDDPLTAGSAEYFDIMGGTDVETRWSPDQQAAYGAFTAEAVTRQQYEQAYTGQEGQQWTDWKGKQEAKREKERSLGWGTTYGRDAPPKLPPPMPKTPEFLRGVYPELGARLPRDKAEAPMYPLSGQQWGQMLPSQRQQWGGYIGWAGGKPEDLYAQMQQMTPQYRPGTSWSPARQM